MPARKKSAIFANSMRMWPREVFDYNGIADKLDMLAKPGVYVLYRDDVPYYIGQARTSMRGRIKTHATDPTQRRYHFWNYFSAFHIPEPDQRSDVEAILIAAMPTANSANPRLPKDRTPNEVRDLLRRLRAQRAFAPEPMKGRRSE